MTRRRSSGKETGPDSGGSKVDAAGRVRDAQPGVTRYLDTSEIAVEQDYLIDDGLVERLLAALADALRRTRPDPFGSPVTVAEIYQDLIPYRSVRTVLGFQMNADYEHTLLRLLAGENELTRLEPPEAREELQSELEMPNPNVGLFRKFAACDVWLERTDLTLGLETPEPAAARAPEPEAPAAATPEPATAPEVEPEPLSWAAQPSPATPPESAEPPLLELETGFDDADETDDEGFEELVWAEPEPAGEWDAAEGELLLEDEVQDEPTAPDTSEQPAAAGSPEPSHQRESTVMFDSSQSQATVAPTQTAGSCAFCKGSLPGGRVIRFCPHCGMDQSMKPCASCREPLDPTWKFCIACGNQQG